MIRRASERVTTVRTERPGDREPARIDPAPDIALISLELRSAGADQQEISFETQSDAETSRQKRMKSVNEALLRERLTWGRRVEFAA